MLHRWLFALVFAGVVAVSWAVSVFFVPDFASIERYRVDPNMITRAVGADGLTKYTWMLPPSSDGEEMMIYVPVHAGRLRITIDGRDFGEGIVNDAARISRRKLPTTARIASLLSLPGGHVVQLSQLDSRTTSDPYPIYVGPISQLAPVTSQHFAIGPPMRASIPVTTAILFFLAAIMAFLSPTPVRYFCMTAFMALQFAIEIDDQIRIGSFALRDYNQYVSLTRDLLIFYCYNLWFCDNKNHRTIALYMFGLNAAFLLYSNVIALRESSLTEIILISRTVGLAAYCAYSIWRSKSTTIDENRIALALFATWVTSNLTYLAFLGPSGSAQRDFIAANYVNVSMVLALSLLVVGGIALEWIRYRDALKSRHDLTAIMSGHRMQLDQQARSLQDEIEKRAILQERERFTRDMHDGIGGNLLTMLLKARREGTDASELRHDIEQSIHDLRLVTASLDGGEAGLPAALCSFRERIGEQLSVADMALDWQESDGVTDTRLGVRETLELLRTLQEAVTNAVRHSHGSVLRIEISSGPHERALKIIVRDDGVGLASDTVHRSGLRNMAQRIERLGGTLRLTNDSGLQIAISLPCDTASVSRNVR